MWQILLKLLIAVSLSSIIGIERESERKPAGLRTIMLIALNSVLISACIVHLNPQILGHAISGVLSGMGFIGAGTIIGLVDKKIGITTAATLWLASGIGFTVGLGYYIPAVGATVIGLFILEIVERIEPRKKEEFVKKND